MWECKHEPWCKDQSKYLVMYDAVVVKDTNYNSIGKVEFTDVQDKECANCHAHAEWNK